MWPLCHIILKCETVSPNKQLPTIPTSCIIYGLTHFNEKAFTSWIHAFCKMWGWRLKKWWAIHRCSNLESLLFLGHQRMLYFLTSNIFNCRSNCYTVPEQNCVDIQTPVQKQNCETIKNCQQVEQQKCETITVQKCNNCQQVSRQICEDVQTEKTVFVTSKQCDSIPQDVCNTVEM